MGDLVYVALFSIAFFACSLSAEVIPVRHTEGTLRTFASLKSQDGKTLASGDLLQSSLGGKVTSKTVFHFKDGSVQEEIAVFTQLGNFRLLSYHLIQKGPTFPEQIDFSFDTTNPKVTVKYRNKDAKSEVIEEKMELPADIANGIVPILLKNVPPTKPLTEVAMLVATPKPRLVKLKITPAGEAKFRAGEASEKAHRFQVRVDIGGLEGLFAKIFGKQPPDTFVWMIDGQVPGIIGSEGPMFMNGPIWRFELVAPKLP